MIIHKTFNEFNMDFKRLIKQGYIAEKACAEARQKLPPSNQVKRIRSVETTPESRSPKRPRERAEAHGSNAEAGSISAGQQITPIFGQVTAGIRVDFLVEDFLNSLLTVIQHKLI